MDGLGKQLSESVLRQEFKSQPPMSFRLSAFDPMSLDVLGVALNVGALQAEQKNYPSGLIFNLNECRIRVSHRLSPTYPLPTISGRSELIDELPSRNSGIPVQPDLTNL